MATHVELYDRNPNSRLERVVLPQILLIVRLQLSQELGKLGNHLFVDVDNLEKEMLVKID